MLFTKINLVICLINISILSVTGCSDSSNSVPANEVSQIEVRNWGPHTTNVGKSFNIQPNGESAIWFETTWTGKAESLIVRIDNQTLDKVAVNSGKAISVTIPSSFLIAPKKSSIKLINKVTGQQVDVGVFEVTQQK
jgi:hypothetical protein